MPAVSMHKTAAPCSVAGRTSPYGLDIAHGGGPQSGQTVNSAAVQDSAIAARCLDKSPYDVTSRSASSACGRPRSHWKAETRKGVPKHASAGFFRWLHATGRQRTDDPSRSTLPQGAQDAARIPARAPTRTYTRGHVRRRTMSERLMLRLGAEARVEACPKSRPSTRDDVLEGDASARR